MTSSDDLDKRPRFVRLRVDSMSNPQQPPKRQDTSSSGYAADAEPVSRTNSADSNNSPPQATTSQGSQGGTSASAIEAFLAEQERQKKLQMYSNLMGPTDHGYNTFDMSSGAENWWGPPQPPADDARSRRSDATATPANATGTSTASKPTTGNTLTVPESKK